MKPGVILKSNCRRQNCYVHFMGLKKKSQQFGKKYYFIGFTQGGK